MGPREGDRGYGMSRSYVVTGGGGGVGRAIVERLLRDGDTVVAIDTHPDALGWVVDHPAGDRIIAVAGDATDERAAIAAADRAETAAPLVGWVNCAAVFRDAAIHETATGDLMAAISVNIELAVVGCAVAVRHFVATGIPGAIVNVSSHQAQRAVPGSLPYSIAKAAIEGLTRALAVDYGRNGIRVNAVALGTITTRRYEDDLRRLEPEVGGRIDRGTQRLNALERVGRPEEVADVVAFLLSADHERPPADLPPDQPTRFQLPIGRHDRRPADPEAPRQVALGRQPVAEREIAPAHGGGECIGQLPGQCAGIGAVQLQVEMLHNAHSGQISLQSQGPLADWLYTWTGCVANLALCKRVGSHGTLRAVAEPGALRCPPGPGIAVRR